MNITQLNVEIENYAEMLKTDTLSLSQIESYLNSKNIYHYAIKNFYSQTEIDCYLIILIDEKWFLATGSPYFVDTEITFDFYIDTDFFEEIKQKDIQHLQNNLNKFREDIENALAVISNPDATRKITLEKFFTPDTK